MDRREFLMCMQYLKNNYRTFNFEFDNKEVLSVWYNNFKTFPYEKFLASILKYCNENDFPPNSPRQLLLLCEEDDGEKIWEWLELTNMKYRYDNDFTSGKFFTEISKNKLAYKIFKDRFYDRHNLFKGNIFDKEPLELEDVSINFSVLGIGYEYRKKIFVEAYERSKKAQIHELLTSLNYVPKVSGEKVEQKISYKGVENG